LALTPRPCLVLVKHGYGVSSIDGTAMVFPPLMAMGEVFNLVGLEECLFVSPIPGCGVCSPPQLIFFSVSFPVT